jgi:hypothetical protein
MGAIDYIRNTRVLLACFVSVACLLVLSPVGASASSAPLKLKFAGQFGREVNATEAGKGLQAEDICLATTGDTCQPGKESAVAGGFLYAKSTAVDKATGDVYAADEINNRIEKLKPNGEFLLTWGLKVNNKEGGSICRAAEINECGAGVRGSGAGQMNEAQSVAVDNTCFEEKLSEPACKTTDPANGDVYVLDFLNHRIDEFGPEGQFILMFGGEVNKKNGNVCVAAESSECRAGKTGSANGFFQTWAQFKGNMLAVGGPEHLVYVADEGRVQEFERTGAYKTQITLTSTTPAFLWLIEGKSAIGTVNGLAVDTMGDAFITESHLNSSNSGAPAGIYEFAPSNATAIKAIETSDSNIEGLALDESGHLAFTNGTGEGTLLDLSGGAPASRFGPPGGMALGYGAATGLSFTGQGALYVAGNGHQDVEMYPPAFGAELVVTQPTCREGASVGAAATVDCTLSGELDAWGVKETEAWFKWGTTSLLGEETGKQKIANTKPNEGEQEPLVNVSAAIEGLVPNETVYYEFTASDHNFKAPEASPQFSLITPTVAPRVVGALSASFITSESAVLVGEVDPEHASTAYFVEYASGEALAACPDGVRKEACTGVLSTRAVQSEKYQTIRGTLEATGLRPGTTYHFRLTAINEKSETAVTEAGSTSLPEGIFTTAPTVLPHATTGSYSAVSATGAVISGEVNPDGKPASYAFELGVYNPAGIQYGIVQSGSAGEGTSAMGEEMQLSGLQPGTSYAYRIKIESTYGTSYGDPVVFTTQGASEVLPIPVTLAFLPVPSTAFPKQATVRTLTRAQKLKVALSVCKRKHNHKRRTGCEREARKRYGPKTQKGSKRGK